MSTTGKEVVNEFPVSTLEDWYPLYPGYTYKYMPRNRSLVLYAVKQEVSGAKSYWDCGKSRYFRRKNPDKGTAFSLEEGTWEATTVKQENQRIIALARDMGVPVFDDFWTPEELQEGYLKVLDAISELTAKIVNRATCKGMCVKGTDEDIEEALANYTQPEEEEKYIELGCILTMLGAMRRVSIER